VSPKRILSAGRVLCLTIKLVCRARFPDALQAPFSMANAVYQTLTPNVLMVRRSRTAIAFHTRLSVRTARCCRGVSACLLRNLHVLKELHRSVRNVSRRSSLTVGLGWLSLQDLVFQRNHLVIKRERFELNRAVWLVCRPHVTKSPLSAQALVLRLQH
jgi:hypothetical protein